MIVAIAVSILIFTEKKKRLLIAVPAILALTAIIIILVEPARNLLMRFFGREMLSSIHKFLSGRWHLFVTAFGHYLEKPLLGYGGSVEATAILIYKSTDMAKVVHNDYLGVAIQYGLPGILVFMVMYLKLIGDFIVKIFSGIKNLEWQYPLYILLLNVILAGLVLSINFSDYHIYILAFVLAIPTLGLNKEAGHGN
jgi:O-antigen ligase